MMLYVVEKIITLSCCEQVKVPEDFHHYFVLLFSCIVELLIEIIQGTEDSNFLSLINQKFDGNQRLMINANRMDPVLKKGKAFDSFLKCVKNLIISDDQNSEELDSIRKMLMDFFLAFHSCISSQKLRDSISTLWSFGNPSFAPTEGNRLQTCLRPSPNPARHALPLPPTTAPPSRPRPPATTTFLRVTCQPRLDKAPFFSAS